MSTAVTALSLWEHFGARHVEIGLVDPARFDKAATRRYRPRAA